MSFTRIINIKGKKYLIEVESYWKDGKPRQRFIRYLGRIKEDKLIPPRIERLKVKAVCSFGLQLVLSKIIESFNLSDWLDESLLALAMLNIIEPSSINRAILNFYKYSLDKVFNFKMDKSIYNLDLSEDFIFRKELELYKLFKLGYKRIFYDITDLYFYGTKCYLAKKGYSAKSTLPSIKIGLVIDNKGFPMFHKLFPGNVGSYKTLNLIINCLRAAKIRDCTIVLDRGFFSKDNVNLAKKEGYDLIVAVPRKGRLKRIKPSTKWELIRLKSTYIYAKRFGNFIICYNEPEAVRMKKIAILRGIKPKDYGIYVLYSSKRLGIEQVIKCYFEKDLIERSFRCLKSVLGLQPTYTWVENKINLHLFICFLSYLFLNCMLIKLADLKMSLNKIIDELKCIYRIEFEDGMVKYSTLSKNQEKILKRFDLVINL